MCSYTDIKIFTRELLLTYSTIIDIVRFSGDSGIVNKKRQEAYKKAIETVEDIYDSGKVVLDMKQYIKYLNDHLTAKPCKIMKDLYKNGKVILEDKEPYNARCIQNGKIVKEEGENLEAFQNLNALSGIGIGIGDSAIKELAAMGYTSIDELKKIYDLDEFKNFRKGIKGPLCKYFEGTVRIEKMSREEATKWKKTIDNLINSIAVEIADIKYNIAGSYARKKELIGDIDYVIVINDNDKLFEVLNEILDKLTRLTRIQNLSVSLDSVVETPSKPTKSRYTTGIKAWFNMPDGKKTKIEIYGYSMDLEDFCFAYYARAADVDLQKKIKYFASRKGYKLSPFGLFDKKTDNSIYKIPEQLEILQEKLNKEKITSIKDLYKFLDYNHS